MSGKSILLIKLFSFLQEQEIQLICFQSRDRDVHVEIPLEIVGTLEISDRCLRVRIVMEEKNLIIYYIFG